VNQTSPAQPTIALAESSKAMCSMFQEALAGADVEFVFLHEPRAVLEYLEEHTPNLLLISTKMPGKGGFSLLRECRKNPRSQNIPVIVISSKDYMQDRLIAKELNVLEFLVKPFSMQQIRTVVLDTLGQAGGQPEKNDS